MLSSLLPSYPLLASLLLGRSILFCARSWLKARQEDLQLSTGSVKGGNLQGGVINVVAGGCAGAIATSASYPLDLLRTRLASCTGPLIGALRSEVTQVKGIVWKGGILHFCVYLVCLSSIDYFSDSC